MFVERAVQRREKKKKKKAEIQVIKNAERRDEM